MQSIHWTVNRKTFKATAAVIHVSGREPRFNFDEEREREREREKRGRKKGKTMQALFCRRTGVTHDIKGG